jgi:hypothetical protein
MNLHSTHPRLDVAQFRDLVAGLPDAEGYEVTLKPLRYRSSPHLAAETDYDARTIIIRLPEPFFPFGDTVAYGAKRIPAKGLRFVWLSEGVTFRTPRDVIRFLYCHEWMHWFLHERLGRKGSAETTCDRFALRNYLKKAVTIDDARLALRRRDEDAPEPPVDR